MKRNIFFLFFFFTVLLTAADAPKAAPSPEYDLHFTGKPVSGEQYFCKYSVMESIQYQMDIKGAKKPPFRQENTRYELNGTLNVVQISGKRVILEFAVSTFSANRNGQTLESGKLSDRTVRLNLDLQSGVPEECTLVLPETSSAFPGMQETAETQSVPPALRTILTDLAFSLGSTPSDFCGPDGKRKQQEQWQVPQNTLKKIESANGLDQIAADRWRTKVILRGTANIQGLLCCRVDAAVYSNAIPGYDSKTEAMYMIPQERKNPVPLSTEFHITEIRDRIMPDNNPVFSGTKYTEITRRDIVRTLFPCDVISGDKREK